MRRVYKAGYFRDMSPVCPGRLAEYEDLRYVAALTPEQLTTADREDLTDAQHQWVMSFGKRGCTSVPMQRCDDCPAVRPTPLRDYPEALQVSIMQLFTARTLTP